MDREPRPPRPVSGGALRGSNSFGPRGDAAEVLRHIGRRIQFLRTRRYGARLTQAQVAAAADLSVSFLSMIERGERSPSVNTLADVARALTVPLFELFRFDDDRPPLDPSFHRLASFARAKGLGAAELDRMLEVARAMFE